MNKHEQHLGFWGVFSIAAGAMISSGLFVLPGIAFAQAGPGVVVSYAVAALLILPALLCQAELASAIPRAGATYVFIERSLGTQVGTFAGLASWFAIALKSAFALVGIGAFARLIWPDTPDWVVKAVAVSFCILFTTLNLMTVKGVGRAQLFMVGGLLIVIIGYIVLGAQSPEFTGEAFSGFTDKGWNRILMTSGLVFVSFGGLTATADISGEVKNAQRNVPLGMLCALPVVGLLYVGAVSITVGVIPAGDLAGNMTPLSAAASKIVGSWGGYVLAFAAMLAFITTANGGILEASRSPEAMSRDGLLPASIGKKSRFGTPTVSVLATGVFMTAALVLLSIENLVKAASTMLLMLYILSCLAVLVMNKSPLQNYKPGFRVPLGPVLPLLGIVAYLFLIGEMGKVPVLTCLVFAAGGVVWYLIYIRPRIARESALVTLVRRLVSKAMYRSNLDEELKQIALERDEIVYDRFDRLVQTAAILDLPHAVSIDSFFGAAGVELAKHINLSASDIARLLKERETESCTVLQPGLAVPHFFIPGEKQFIVLPVRCKKGIHFSDDQPPVHTAFILGATPDERNFHLRALMAIAQIVKEPEFNTRWFSAADSEHLRDAILMASRRRDT